MPKYSIIIGFLGQTKDRFHTYNDERDLDGKLELLSSIPGYTGAEVVYPYEATDSDTLLRLMKTHGVEISAINANVKGEPEFASGGLTSTDAAIRQKAVGFIKKAKDFAKAVGAPQVTCCPLGDGFEFPFQTDYRRGWTYLCDAFAEAGDYLPEITLFIEYKPKETRRHCFINRAADALCLINDTRSKHLGVTIDYGHSIYAGEHPSEALSRIHYAGVPYYIHINDNDKTWDWDFFTGSHTLLDYIEFIYHAKKFSYNDFFTSDTHPTRWDLKRTFEINSRLTEKIWRRLDEVGMEKIEDMLDNGDYPSTWHFIETELLGFKDLT